MNPNNFTYTESVTYPEPEENIFDNIADKMKKTTDDISKSVFFPNIFRRYKNNDRRKENSKKS